MIKIKAKIQMFKDVKKLPIATGYFAGFSFMYNLDYYTKYPKMIGTKESKLTSGSITLLEKDLFYPGETQQVLINFIYKEFLGDDFGVGKSFTVFEPPRIIGEGIIEEIIEFNPPVLTKRKI